MRPEVCEKAGERDAMRAELGAGDRTASRSFGGSLGARRVDEVVADLCAWEQKEHKPVLHIHATGQYGVELFQNLEKEKGFAPGERLVVKEYINNMHELLAAADLVISRAGALTLAELEDTPVDMFTTVYIGNGNTRALSGRMVTPRGYRK